MTIALFSFFAAVTIGFGFVVALSREIFRATFGLLGTLCGVAVLIALLGATTVAALQVLIYAGGVFVLFLFAILVTDRPGAGIFRRRKIQTFTAVLLSFGFAAVLLSSMTAIRQPLTAVSAMQIGRSLILGNVLVFEAVSVLLLAGLASAIVVMRKELK